MWIWNIELSNNARLLSEIFYNSFVLLLFIKFIPVITIVLVILIYINVVLQFSWCFSRHNN